MELVCQKGFENSNEIVVAARNKNLRVELNSPNFRVVYFLNSLNDTVFRFCRNFKARGNIFNCLMVEAVYSNLVYTKLFVKLGIACAVLVACAVMIFVLVRAKSGDAAANTTPSESETGASA